MNENLLKQLSKYLDIKVEDRNTNESILVVDRGNIDPIIRSCLVSQILNKVKKLNIHVLTEKKKYWPTLVYNAFGIKNFIYPLKLDKIYLYPIITLKFLIIFFQKYLNFLFFRDFNWMIHNLKIFDIHVGDLIYDSYVRYNHNFLKPKKFDIDLIKIFIKTVFIAVQVEYIFKTKNVKQLVVGTATYVSFSSISLRYAVKNKIPAIFAAWFLVLFYEKYERLFHSRQKIFKKDLDKIKLPKDWLIQYKNYSRSRYLGKLDQPDFINAFRNRKILKKKELYRLLNINNKKYSKIILIAPHAFSDASHESFKNIFNDFYDHFISTIKYIKQSRHLDDVLWIVNPHPSSSDYKEEGLVEKILKNYSCENIILFPKQINTYSILKYIDTVITCNGTIGLEFPACFEKKSILAGDAPYSGLGINIEPRNKKQYFRVLDNIKNVNLLNNKKKKLAKKIFFYYECLQLEFRNTSIVPSNRFLKPKKFLKQIVSNLKSNKFKNDAYYKNTYKLIKNKYKLLNV
jgi:hypothetical protein